MATKVAETGIGGKFSIQVETAVGLVQLTDIDMPKGLVLSLKGMNSFRKLKF